MTIPFGPQLIGQTEKTLNALLETALAGRLSETQWVTLRLATQLADDVADAEDLARAVRDRARLTDATSIVSSLTSAGLLHGGRPTERGRAFVTEIGDRVAELAGPVFAGLPDDDVEATTRTLNRVLSRARGALV